MEEQDLILINAKLKAKGMKRDALAKKIHVSLYRLNKVMDRKENYQDVEEKLIIWLTRK